METIEEQSKSGEEELPDPEIRDRICLIGSSLQDNVEILKAAHSFCVHVIWSKNGDELMVDDDEWKTRYVMTEFSGPVYEAINARKKCILGVPAFLWAAMNKQSLPYTNRPVYCFAMRGVVTCFTGIRHKEQLTMLVNLIHSMGGGIRKDMNSRITHLIANKSSGDKYRYAKTFRLAVVRPDWVLAAWDRRDDPTFSATLEEFAEEHRLKIFEGQKVCFVGFPIEEHQHMVDVLIANGGISVELDDPDCAHIVVDASVARPEPANQNASIVSSDWFWYTIQNGYADVTDYLVCDKLKHAHQSTPNSERRDSLPVSFNNKRKRKRFSQRLQLEGTPLGTGKRRSSISETGLMSLSSSFFDYTTSPDKLENISQFSVETETSTFEQTPGKKASMRHNHFTEFFTTESNYVGILNTIVKLFKNPLDDLAETNDALLNKSEIKAIFGNFIPIYEVHQHMLEALRIIHSNWTDTCLIGEVILKYKDDLTKAYPPYVNFFEQMVEALQHCDNSNPRFHAFLKINQSKPECGRETLQQLMIRPVQRLPSTILLLREILKYTSKSNPDYGILEEALKAIKEVMTHINEDKRKNECRFAMFDIFNDIDGCPADLVSSNRYFIMKCDVTELTDNMSGRGDSLVMYLFSDSIEFTKKRSRAFNSAKSPSSAKCYKHLKLMSLNAVRFVVDITDGVRSFALICRQEKDKLYAFTIVEDENEKGTFIRTLCKQIAENACRTDAEKALVCRTSAELGVDISDVHMSTLTKAFKLAARTRMKVGRAFSFNKTPSKLKRAVSTMMTSPFGSTNSLTPASQLAQMRLASCANIHEADDEQSISPENEHIDMEQQEQLPQHEQLEQQEQLVLLKPPLSEQPKRKNKSATIVGRI